MLGYLEYTLTTAGTWDAAPSLVNIYSQGDRLPGETIQIRRKHDGALATGTTILPNDNTVPQNTEGTEFITQAVTPRSSANFLEIEHVGIYTHPSNSGVSAALFQDSTASAIAAITENQTAAWPVIISLKHFMLAGTVASTTFKVRAGSSVAGTFAFNGTSGGASGIFNGLAASFLKITEIMV